jgi:ABC-2 type transport system permease protein
LPEVINAFLFFFIIGAVSLPVGIAAYSVVGEKVEKSLEPLLTTPLTDGEILMGKKHSCIPSSSTCNICRGYDIYSYC